MKSVLALFRGAELDVHEFSPLLLRLQETPPHPLGHAVLKVMFVLFMALLVWALVGKLDIVAVADGKLVPLKYLQVVQPPEAGIVKDILVREGEVVAAGQVLLRMDALITDADSASVSADYQRKLLSLRRIDAQLNNRPFQAAPGDAPALAREIAAQYQANRAAFEATLAEERTRLAKARQDMSAAQRVKAKLEATLPHFQQQEKSFEKLAKEGFAGTIMASDKRRERIEKEEELNAQSYLIESARATIAQSEKKLVQIESDYIRQLHAERNDIQGSADKLAQETSKQVHRKSLLELKAPQAGTVKDLATHTAGTVVQPGTVVLTLVPKDDVLRAEVWVSNEDIGFVHQGQPVKVKLMAYPFQKYGMAEGSVEHVSADSQEPQQESQGRGQPGSGKPLFYKALVGIKAVALEAGGDKLSLAAGMQVSAEIMLGKRTVAEYLLSPVQKAWHEAGRER